MILRTIAIFLSFSAAYSSAAYAMEEDIREQLHRYRVGAEEAERDRAKSLESTKMISQVSDQNSAAFEEVRTRIEALMEAVQNGTMTRQEARIAKDAIIQNHSAQVHARLEETKQFIQRK